MHNIEEIADRIRRSLDARTAARDGALAQTRRLVRHCANAIRAVHRNEQNLAQENLDQAHELVKSLQASLAGYPDLYFAGYTQDALKEYAEANIVYALLLNDHLPTAVAVGLGLVFASFPAVSAPSTLLRPHSTAMLFSGIPGDVESETAYRDQMAAWMEVLDASGMAQQVHVLCDDPRIVPAKPGVTGWKGDRENFLKLAAQAGATNPVLFVAWGHGGNQGSTPVFHVRGPRVAPDDFVGFANRIGTNQSNWVLLFRGSGAFAKSLAAPGRQILSSECNTPFASDPVGMALLLKLVRDEPALPFEKNQLI